MSPPNKIQFSLFRPATPTMRKEIRVAFIVLALWALLSFGIPVGIWLAGLGDPTGFGESFLTRARFLGFPLHYWLVAQGCTIGYVLLCKVYCLIWDRHMRRTGRPAGRPGT